MSIVPPGAAAGMRGGLAPIARRLHALGVSANAVTLTGFVLTVVGSAFLAAGHPLRALLVLIVGTLADTLDGPIAKAAGGGTKLGAFLDSTFDRLSDSALTGAAVVYGAYNSDPFLFWAGLSALVSGSFIPYVRAKAESLGISASVGLAPREARLVLAILGVAGWAVTANPQLFAAALAVVAFLSTITTAQRIAHVANALRNT
jgi:CDP-diacylglycerol--glycerol-3-phosphate 3-phosphatidyltransferase